VYSGSLGDPTGTQYTAFPSNLQDFPLFAESGARLHASIVPRMTGTSMDRSPTESSGIDDIVGDGALPLASQFVSLTTYGLGASRQGRHGRGDP
jgi:hypothetical protein